MDPADQQRLREKYRLITDEALAELHLEGPEAYADPDGWALLDAEYRRRGPLSEGAREFVLTDRATREAVEASVVPLYLRLGAALVDTAVCLLILLPFLALAVSLESIVPALVGLVLGGLLYLPIAESRFQGTLGKRVCGLGVVRDDNGRVTVADAAARAFARAIAWGLLLRPSTLFRLDQPVVLLDDLFSKTRVVRRSSPQAPPN